ncbi:hypothetical protein M2454_001651 [Aequitasia blattaphilus]|uniref:DUF4430 domain-containing protein n=1 Tax=Aequitasia blattaphilus TaxID=2949332 RepID=A0ABT1E7C3_9FIRM|nr:DUF4430 domain-containing protein [Aequitasia blattaphilus]MCP1101514.1 DUF4430 domain-containing protein [Aequitasia blattaphilus]MCR8614154.1 DUF4430 domain-containing protein [Aequitasia blattaphilus]
MKKNVSKKIILGVISFLVIISALLIVYTTQKPKTQQGAKNVTLTVISKSGAKTDYTLKTNSQYLQEVMDEAKDLTYDGVDGEYGFVVEKVNGEIAKFEDKGAYWAFSVNGEYCNYGISTQPVEDGDEFEIAYTTE